MKRPNRWIVLIFIVALIGGGAWYMENHLTEDQISQEVKNGLQQQLDQGDLKDVHLQVSKITLLHDQGNRYQAIAGVLMDGKSHDVNINVLVDGRKVAWKTDDGAFLFVAQALLLKAADGAMRQEDTLATQIQKQEAPSAAPVDESNSMPPSTKALAAQWLQLNETCRGGSGDDPATQQACDKRENVYAQIHAANWCWGHKDDDGASRTWVKCAPGDS